MHLKISDLAIALKEIYKSDVPISIIGTRHSEKLYETLMSKEEIIKSDDLGNYFRINADNRDLNYNKYFFEGKNIESDLEDYHSHNTNRLTKSELIDLLKKIGYK